MAVFFLSLSALISSVFAIIFRTNGRKILFAIFKPLTTILIISIAIVVYAQSRSTYMSIILISLLFALIGDIFLIGTKLFIYGLSSFLIAHIGFAFAFASLFGFQWTILPLLFLLPVGVLFYKYLSSDLGKFMIPVGVYIVFILVMNWQAISLSLIEPALVFLGIGLGSVLFSFSDAIIAINKFKKPFALAEFLILTTYWLAIYIFVIAGLYT